MGAAYDEDVFALETLGVVFGFAAFDVAVLGEDAARYHFWFTTWTGTIFPKRRSWESFH